MKVRDWISLVCHCHVDLDIMDYDEGIIHWQSGFCGDKPQPLSSIPEEVLELIIDEVDIEERGITIWVK